MLSKSTFKESINAEAKNNVTAHILLILFGWLGVHRFYIDAIKSGILMLALLLLSVLMVLTNLGVAGFVALFFWWVLDVFTLHQLVQKRNAIPS